MNINRSFILIIILVGLMASPVLQAQDYKRQYKAAREFFDNKNYGLAMEAFKPLIVYDRDNSFLEHSSFFYALSAYHQKFPAVAKDMLLQIKQLYPNWSQMSEVNYWMAKIYFDQRQYFQAMQVLREYPTLNQQQNVVEMKHHYHERVFSERPFHISYNPMNIVDLVMID